MLDPYANAFCKDASIKSPHTDDKTDMKAGVYERKFEVDSLVAPLRLLTEYIKVTQEDSIIK